MNRIAKLQARACAISTGEATMKTFEKVILTVAGVALAGGLLTWAIARSTKSTTAAGEKMDAIESKANALA